MAQVGRPRGLIDYITFEDADRERAGEPTKPVIKTLLRPRTIIYFSIWAAIGLAMLFALGSRTRLDVAAQHDRNPLFVQLSNGDIRNAYTVKIRNMENRPRDITVIMAGPKGATMWTDDSKQTPDVTRLTRNVPADSVAKLRIYVAASSEGPPREEISFAVQGPEDKAPIDREEAFFERAQP
jgi:polyferredoxin